MEYLQRHSTGDLDEVIGELLSKPVTISHQTNRREYIQYFVKGSICFIVGSVVGYITSLGSKIPNKEFPNLAWGLFALTSPYLIDLFQEKDEDTPITKKITALGYAAGFTLVYSVMKN